MTTHQHAHRPDLATGQVAGRCYMYGVGGSRLPNELLTGIAGLNDEPLVAVRAGGAVAVVSAAPTGRLRPERRHLAAHQRVVAGIARSADFLPVAFGMIADDAAAVASLLDTHGESIAEQLQRVAGCIEMTLRVGLGGANAFEHFVTRDAGLRHLRDAMIASAGPGGSPSHDAKLAAGRGFESALAGARELVERTLAEHFEGVCHEYSAADCRGEGQLANLACLVDRAGVAPFEQAVERAAAELDDAYTIELSGPWPCHSFVDLRLSPASESADVR